MAQTLATWFACDRIILCTIGAMPLVIKDMDNKPILEEISDLWNNDSRSILTGPSLTRWAHNSATYEGNGYVRIVEDDGGRPFRFVALVDTRVSPKAKPPEKITSKDDWAVEYDLWPRTGEADTVDGRYILHFKSILNNGIRGESILHGPARSVVNINLLAESFAGNTFTMTPLGEMVYLNPAGDLTDDDMLMISESFQDNHIGLESRSKLKFVKGGDSLLQLNNKARENQLLESREWGAKEVCRIRGVPQELVGLGSSGNPLFGSGDGIRESVKVLIRQTILPSIEDYATEIKEKLFIRGEKVKVEFDYSKLLEMDEKALADMLKVAVGKRYMLEEEARERAKLPSVKDLTPEQQARLFNDSARSMLIREDDSST